MARACREPRPPGLSDQSKVHFERQYLHLAVLPSSQFRIVRPTFSWPGSCTGTGDETFSGGPSKWQRIHR
jgi:hypothetical protein